MKLDKLLQLDINPRDAADGAFKHNRNVLLSEGMQSIENEGGFELNYDFGEGWYYNGYIGYGNNFILFASYSHPTTPKLRIYKWSNGTVVLLVEYENATYGKTVCISGVSTRLQTDVIIIFTADKGTPTRILNIDNIESDFNKTLFNPLVPLSNQNLKVIPAGNLPKGTYYVSICYGQTYVDSSFIPVHKSIIVGFKTIKREYEGRQIPAYFEGMNADQSTNQGVRIELDTNQEIYDRVSIGIIHDNGTAKNAYIIRDVALDDTGKLTYDVLSLPSLATSEESIVLSKNIYTYFNSMAIVRDRLYIGGVGSPRVLFKDGQELATACTIRFYKEELDEDEDDFLNETSFVNNEIYAMYMYLYDEHMIPLGAWHIPGNSGKIHYPNNYPNLDYFVESNSSIHTNINDTYPIDNGFPQGNVKFHRVNIEGTLKPYERIRAELILPYDAWRYIPYSAKYVGIGYAKRTISNSKVVGTDVILPSKWASSVITNDTTSNSTGHNYKLMAYKLSLSNITHYVVNHAVNDVGNIGEGGVYSPNVRAISNVRQLEMQTMSDIRYIPNDVLLDTVDNRERESHISFNLYGYSNVNTASSVTYYNIKPNYYSNFMHQEIILSNIATLEKSLINPRFIEPIKFKGDSYIGMFSIRQTKHKPSDAAPNDKYYLRIVEYWTQSDIPLIRVEGANSFEKIYPFSKKEDVLDEEFYPKTRDNFINTDTGKCFREAYNSRNLYYSQPSTVDKFIPKLYGGEMYYEDKIVKSAVHNQEGSVLGFATIAASNYHLVPLAMGAIIAIMSDGYKLYIQQMYELFIASVKDVISGQGQESLYIGEGDLFDRPPRPIVYDETGHIGCSSPLHCKLGSLGYIVADKARGRMFLINGDTPLEISNLDSRLYIENKLKTNDIRVGFDYKSKRVFLHLLNDKISLSTHVQVMRHVSFHDYAITNTICAGINTLYMVDNKLVIPTPSKNYGKYGDWIREGTDANIKSSFVDMYYTQAVDIAKLIQTVRWKTISNLDDVDNYNDTIDSIMIYNDTQCTGNLVVNKNPMFFDSASGKLANTAWYFNEINDAVLDDTLPFLDEELQPIPSNVDMAHKDWFNVSKFICDWAVVRLLINNVVQRKIIINSCEIIAQKDSR